MANIFPGQTVQSVNGEVGKVEVEEDRHLIFEQAIPASTWIVPLPEKIMSLTVLDSSGRRVEGDEDYSVPGQVSISFNGAFSGKVIGN